MKVGGAKHEPKLLNFSEYGGRAAFGFSGMQFCRLLLFYFTYGGDGFES